MRSDGVSNWPGVCKRREAVVEKKSCSLERKMAVAG